ncbi:MAG: class I SAM-dependent methyltransferase [Rhodopila sp.]|nr:class I SAM-dependent methyltransferase [Rhodopila sp.]
MDPDKDALSRTAEFWDREHFSPEMQRAEWQNHPLARERMVRLLGGRVRERWFAETYLPANGVERGLGIGVGAGATEMELLGSGAIRHFDLWDVSSAGLAAAREHAARYGAADRVITNVGDIHSANLGENRYDVITFIASLHHIDNLDGVLAQCHRALKPGGVLWAAEYIGPDRFDYPPEHTSLAHDLFMGLDPDLKKSWEPVLRFPTRQEVIDADPTESVHSADIPAAIRRNFDQVQVTPTYGSFAFIMFWGLNHDAIYARPEGERLVRAILAIDEALIDAGKLPHYFSHIVATKLTRRQSLAKRCGIDPAGGLYQALHQMLKIVGSR